MANTHATLTDLFIDIADAIREKTGYTDLFVADEFPTIITEMNVSGATPVLNKNYPADVTIMQASTASATFTCISLNEEGNYTYQWYVNDAIVSGATNSTYTKTNLTIAETYTVYCKVTNLFGTTQSRTAILTVTSCLPTYTYSGTATFYDEGNYNWSIAFKSTGSLTFTDLGNAKDGIDVFLVGGGSNGSGNNGNVGGSGGSGGKIITGKNIIPTQGTATTITVGGAGGQSSAFNISSNNGTVSGAGGSGGSYGSSGTGGGNGAYAFGDSTAVTPLGAGYRFGAGGGGGGGAGNAWSGPVRGGGGAGGTNGGGSGGSGRDYWVSGVGSAAGAATTNSGSGGGGCGGANDTGGGSGGSGIVIIRNSRG